jgi:general secretion pathway protein M
MRLIVTRMPAIEAALLRFDAFWAARSRRERILITVAAALIAGVVLVYGVVKPIQAARAEALADIRTYETFNARLRAAGTLTPVRAQRTGAPATMVGDSAIAAGLAANVEPLPGGARATVADGSFDSVLAWLADVGGTTRLRITRVSIQRRPAVGRVSATVDFLQ